MLRPQAAFLRRQEAAGGCPQHSLATHCTWVGSSTRGAQGSNSEPGNAEAESSSEGEGSESEEDKASGPSESPKKKRKVNKAKEDARKSNASHKEGRQKESAAKSKMKEINRASPMQSKLIVLISQFQQLRDRLTEDVKSEVPPFQLKDSEQ